MVVRSYKYRIYPTNLQKEKILFVLERCRLLYNRLLEERKIAYESFGVMLNYYEQANTLPDRKRFIPELNQVFSQVLQDVARRLDKSFQSFFRRVKEGDVSVGYPRFKPESRYKSFTYTQHNHGFRIADGKLHLSKIGNIKIKLHRQPQGKMKTCTIIEKNGKFYACLSCEVEFCSLPVINKHVGVDLGIKHLAITSDGQFFDSPNYLRKSERKLKHLQRSVSRKKIGSNRRKKTVSILAKLYEHVANQRKDYAHKISRNLVNSHDLIAFENLNTKGMVKNHKLAKSISDTGWYQLVLLTTYKAESAGRRVVLVDPRNTSQECSNCGSIVKKKLSTRTHKCNHCGLKMDRDVNAAINILKRAL